MPDCRPPLAAPSRPRHALPPGACDAHCHVFGPADVFPYAEGRSYTPPDAPYQAMAALHSRLGVERAVVVQANCHGSDHRALLDALAQSGGRYRGVALLGADATEAGVRQLHEGGVRAARFNFVPHLGGAPDPAVFDRVVALIAPLGWHLCLHLDGAMLPGLLPRLAALPLPFVVDHMGRLKAGDGLASPAMQALLGLAQVPQAWVKVSGIDRIASGKRPFAEGLPFVRALAEALPDRCLWGMDWPHPNVAGDMPDDGELVDLFFEACPDAALRQRILVDNPARLYGFESARQTPPP
ncbi:amidohydrolase family protein [Achromobacter aegrifaciens]|uniref:amidohydrolase family protein n=1 Tax=Achromobacter aegrifaciens TaxID=1287736 RepID=UPI001AD83028|nr:amidohydrolase family protein [Achromobacter aegrifaciens]